jgi:hypothetical protein
MLESVKQNQQIQKRPLLSDCPLPIIKNNWKINIDFSMGLLDLTIYGTPCITQERQSTLYYMTEIFPLDYKRPKHSPSRDEGNPHAHFPRIATDKIPSRAFIITFGFVTTVTDRSM